MANKKYTELPQANAITGAEILAMVQDGGSVQGDIDLIKAYFDTLYASGGTWAADTLAGYGSTANKIPYFTNVRTDDTNGKFTVSNGSTNGLSITADVAGLYSFTYWYAPSAGEYLGLSLNSASLATSVLSLAGAERVALSCSSSGSIVGLVALTIRLEVGDVIRPHNTGVGGGTAAHSGFRVEYVGAA